MYILRFHKRVKKFIESKDKKTKDRFKKILLELAKNPFPSNPNINAKKLKNEIPNKFRLIIGKYRFLYFIIDDFEIVIEKADSRGDIYK